MGYYIGYSIVKNTVGIFHNTVGIKKFICIKLNNLKK